MPQPITTVFPGEPSVYFMAACRECVGPSIPFGTEVDRDAWAEVHRISTKHTVSVAVEIRQETPEDARSTEEWQVHVLGRDEILEAASYPDARWQAHQMNHMVINFTGWDEFMPRVWAVPVPKGHFAYPLKPGQTV